MSSYLVLLLSYLVLLLVVSRSPVSNGCPRISSSYLVLLLVSRPRCSYLVLLLVSRPSSYLVLLVPRSIPPQFPIESGGTSYNLCMRFDPISFVEACYDLERTNHEWLQQVAEMSHAGLGPDLGVHVGDFRYHAGQITMAGAAMHKLGFSLEQLYELQASAPEEFLNIQWRCAPRLTSLREMMAGHPGFLPEEFFTGLKGIHDVQVVMARDGSDGCIYIANYWSKPSNLTQKLAAAGKHWRRI